MKKLSLLFVFALCGLIAFAQPPVVPANPGASFGAKIKKANKGAIPAGNLEAMLAATPTDKPIKVIGKIAEVCTGMGCWVRMETANGQTMMIKMKDHAFFVQL